MVISGFLIVKIVNIDTKQKIFREFVFDDGDVPGQCAQDTKRTEAFQSAIESVIKAKNDCVVLDCGTGAGLLAFFAVRAGAKYVVAVEGNKYLARWAQLNVERNGYGDKLQIVIGDATTFKWPNGIVKPDVVVCEMLTTWCVSEHQVDVMNAMHERGIAKTETIFLPQSQECYVSLANTDYSVQDVDLFMPQHHWNWYPKSSPLRVTELTKRNFVTSINFNTINQKQFNGFVDVVATIDGVANSLYLTSKTVLCQDISLEDTMAMNAPIAFPLMENIVVQKGNVFTMKIQYEFSGGFEKFNVQIKRKK